MRAWLAWLSSECTVPVHACRLIKEHACDRIDRSGAADTPVHQEHVYMEIDYVYVHLILLSLSGLDKKTSG